MNRRPTKYVIAMVRIFTNRIDMGQLLFVMKLLACAFWRNIYQQWDVALQAFRAVSFKIPPRDSFKPRNIFPRHNHATLPRTSLTKPKQTAAVSQRFSTWGFSLKKKSFFGGLYFACRLPFFEGTGEDNYQRHVLLGLHSHVICRDGPRTSGLDIWERGTTHSVCSFKMFFKLPVHFENCGFFEPFWVYSRAKWSCLLVPL